MRRATTLCHLLRIALVAVLLALGLAGARAQGVELTALELKRGDSGLTLEFSARLTLSHAVEDALQRGVPMYFTAHAEVYRQRWYWRDARVARVTRSWRLSYQPLTSTWRVSLGALGQNFSTLSEALAVVSRVSGWHLADAQQLDSDEHYYVEFDFRLDTSQLPRPMQIGMGGEWALGIGRTLKVD